MSVVVLFGSLSPFYHTSLSLLFFSYSLIFFFIFLYLCTDSLSLLGFVCYLSFFTYLFSFLSYQFFTTFSLFPFRSSYSFIHFVGQLLRVRRYLCCRGRNHDNFTLSSRTSFLLSMQSQTTLLFIYHILSLL